MLREYFVYISGSVDKFGVIKSKRGALKLSGTYKRDLTRVLYETSTNAMEYIILSYFAQNTDYCLLHVLGVRVSVTFHLMCVHINFSSGWVSEWPPFGKELLTRLTICSLCIWLFVILGISRFGFGDWIWVLIASIPSLAYFAIGTREIWLNK